MSRDRTANTWQRAQERRRLLQQTGVPIVGLAPARPQVVLDVLGRELQAGDQIVFTDGITKLFHVVSVEPVVGAEIQGQRIPDGTLMEIDVLARFKIRTPCAQPTQEFLLVNPKPEEPEKPSDLEITKVAEPVGEEQ